MAVRNVPNISVSLLSCREQGNCRFCSRLLPPLESSLASALPAHVQQVAQQTVAYMAVVFQGQVSSSLVSPQSACEWQNANGKQLVFGHKTVTDNCPCGHMNC